jgi:hypothetical protein
MTLPPGVWAFYAYKFNLIVVGRFGILEHGLDLLAPSILFLLTGSAVFAVRKHQIPGPGLATKMLPYEWWRLLIYRNCVLRSTRIRRQAI